MTDDLNVIEMQQNFIFDVYTKGWNDANRGEKNNYFRPGSIFWMAYEDGYLDCEKKAGKEIG